MRATHGVASAVARGYLLSRYACELRNQSDGAAFDREASAAKGDCNADKEAREIER